jgi:predicted nucleic acid-binding protein
VSAASATGRGSVVVDTMVFGAKLVPRGKATVERYRPVLAGRSVLVSFVSLAEARFGARRARWGPAKMLELAAHFASADVVWPGDDLTDVYADLRNQCERAGHGLGAKIHEADRWIAATAVWLGVPLVSDDRIFREIDGLEVLTQPPG